MSHAQLQPSSSGLGGSWWAYVLRGLLALLFGLLVIVWPGFALYTLPLLITLLGAYILVDGILTVIAAIRPSEEGRLLPLIEGVLGILAGVVALVQPGIAALAVLYLVAAWAVLSGLSKIAQAIRGRTGHGWLMVASGVITVVFGVVLVFMPGASLLALVWVMGIYAIAVGIAFIAFGLRARGYQGPTSSRVR